MTPFEKLATDIVTGTEAARDRILNFGYNQDTQYALSCINASLVIWLVASEEKRLGDSFTKSVIANLPETNDASWGENIRPITGISLKKRMQALWGIRVAYTHGAGDLTKLNIQKYRVWAEEAAQVIPGCFIENNILDCSKMHSALPIKSIVMVQEVLK